MTRPPYRWIIDVDHLAEGEKAPTNLNAKGMMGPRACNLSISCWAKFRMLDDDRVLCYEGRSSRVGFEPLDDFGTPNAGCTIIQYLAHDGTWADL